MLDDGAGGGPRWIEFGDAFVRRVGVVDVVVGKLLALRLPRGGDAEALVGRAVERRRLVRILAVAQFFDQPAADGTEIGRIVAELAREPVGDRRIVGGGAGKSLGAEAPAQRKRRHAAVPGKFIKQDRVIGRLDNDGDITVVFRGGADHRRAADIDILDAIVEAGAARHGFLKRIKIDDQKIDRPNAMRAHRFGMRGVAADGEQTAMHGRMQRLDAAVHHFRKAGQIGHVDHVQTGLAQLFARAAGRNQLDAVVVQRVGELDQAGLVRDGNKGARGAAQWVSHGSLRAIISNVSNNVFSSSWLGLSRPSTSIYRHAKAWMPGTRPSMTEHYHSGSRHSGNLHSGSLGSFSRTRRVVPAFANVAGLACARLQTTRGAACASPLMTICAARRGPSLPAR